MRLLVCLVVAFCFLLSAAQLTSAQALPWADSHQLPMDTAQLRMITSNSSSPHSLVTLRGITRNCYLCSKQPLLQIGPATNFSLYSHISTQWAWDYTVQFNSGDGVINSSDITFHLGEHGSYTLIVDYDESGIHTHLRKDVEPSLTYLPLIVGFIVIAGLAVVLPLLSRVYNKVMLRESAINYYEGDLREESKQNSRVASLDVFRGMSITIMIFVNYGGGGYWFFNHSYWNGLTVADLVFPWFIFIMGVAMPLSFNGLVKKGVSKTQMAMKIVRRTVILFALGLFINNGADILNWRIPGVLQRFAVSYLFTGLILTYVPTFGAKGGMKTEPIDFRSSETEQLLTSRTPKYRSSFFPFLLQWLVALLILTIWFIITFALPVPGCPTGYLGPGGISEGGRYYNCTGGAARYVDLKIFTLKHIYQTPTCQPVYHTDAYDPEGFLGCFTSVFLCFLGTQAGRIIQVHVRPLARVVRWVVWGVGFGSLGTLLALGSQNDGWIPINKNLWSPSFIFVMAGLGFLALSLYYMLVDVWKIWSGAPFLWVGMNPILIYCGHETLNSYFPFSFYTTHSYSSHALTLASNMIGVGSWLLIAYKMYSNDFFVSI